MKKEQLAEICQRIIKLSEAEETATIIEYADKSLTRFANNVIHQNVSENQLSCSIQLVKDKKTVRVATNKFDDDTLKTVIRQASEMLESQKPIPDLPPMPEPQIYHRIKRFDPEIVEIEPVERARRVKKAISLVKKHKLNSAGFMETITTTSCLCNSKGLQAFHEETQATFSITCLSDSSSGWAEVWSHRLADIDPTEAAQIAIKKAVDSKDPKEFPPGKYTTILEPAAVSDLMLFVLMSFNGLAVYEKRSFFTNKLNQKVFGENITIEDNVYHPSQFGAPFDGEGVMRKRLVLIDKGVLRNLVYDRLTAKRAGAEPTGHGFPPPNAEGAYPLNLVIHGGTTPIETMISQTETGILITHLWYIRYLDPVQLTITGMTRDGTFLIENGKIKHAVKNMRFNISLPEILNNVDMLGIETRASGTEAVPMVAPAIRIKDFTFSSTTLY